VTITSRAGGTGNGAARASSATPSNTLFHVPISDGEASLTASIFKKPVIFSDFSRLNTASFEQRDCNLTAMAPRQIDFGVVGFVLNRKVALPPSLDVGMIQRAVARVEPEVGALVEIYAEQRNVFSTIVSIFGARALANVSTYEPNPDRFKAQTFFPDLIRKGARRPPPPRDSLESKASLRAWPLQAHYDHEGWFLVWRYLVDPGLARRPVVIWRVDVAYLRKTNWKYEGSSAGAAGGGRTHTFGVRNPVATFRDKAVYVRTDYRLVGGKPVPT